MASHTHSKYLKTQIFPVARDTHFVKASKKYQQYVVKTDDTKY